MWGECTVKKNKKRAVYKSASGCLCIFPCGWCVCLCTCMCICVKHRAPLHHVLSQLPLTLLHPGSLGLYIAAEPRLGKFNVCTCWPTRASSDLVLYTLLNITILCFSGSGTSKVQHLKLRMRCFTSLHLPITTEICVCPIESTKHLESSVCLKDHSHNIIKAQILTICSCI